MIRLSQATKKASKAEWLVSKLLVQYSSQKKIWPHLKLLEGFFSSRGKSALLIGYHWYVWANLYFPYTWRPESPRKALQVAARAAGFSWGQDQRVYFSIWEALDEVRQKWDGRGGENMNIGQRTGSIFLFMPKKQQNTYFPSPSVSLELMVLSTWLGYNQSLAGWEYRGEL